MHRRGNPRCQYAFDLMPNPQMVKKRKRLHYLVLALDNYDNSQTPLVGAQLGQPLQRVIWRWLVIQEMLTQVYTLGQQFSSFSLSRNHLEDLLKHTSLDPTFRISNSVGWWKELRICILTLSRRCCHRWWGPPFENHSPRPLFTGVHNEMCTRMNVHCQKQQTNEKQCKCPPARE